MANLVKEAILAEKIDIYEKLMFASARGLAIALNMTDDQIQKQLPHMIGDKLAAHVKRDGERFFEAVEKTRKKLRFVA